MCAGHAGMPGQPGGRMLRSRGAPGGEGQARESAIGPAPRIIQEERMLSDPRVFFAAERTLLAWVRTGLTIMGFGFVVAKFGLFLRMLATSQGAADTGPPLHTSMSTVVGIALVLLGTACMILGAIQHR